MNRQTASSIVCCIVLTAWFGMSLSPAEDTKPAESKDRSSTKENADQSKLPDRLVPLNKQKTVLFDKPGNRVILKAKVVLREGLLEMLCCPKATKEHEAVLSVDAKARIVHAALVALGLDPGTPVKYEPKFQAPTGPKLDIYLNWKDSKGKQHRDKAQTWVRHAVRRYYVAKMANLPNDLTLPKKGDLTYDAKHGELLWYGHMTKEQREINLAKSKDAEFKKAINRFYNESQPREMEADFVFAGSQFFKDEKTGEEFYAAEGGDLICVANFPTATIDVAMQSSSTGNENLMFEPYTERIPPLDTDVTIELIPVKNDAGSPVAPAEKSPKE